MRGIEASRKRWSFMFPNGKINLDLRQAVRDPEIELHPCEVGLRSVCWKVFLLLDSVDQASWPKKIFEWRSTYTSLSEHFLRHIDHPNDLQTTVDPLADDESSPWNAVRRDELNREEILQDVKRCMQDISFFQAPSTQRMLLDILFIYSKLHPDIGYRQGMHELLAPILWVVYCDAVETSSSASVESQDVSMIDMLDPQFIQHDAFTLFCAVMQASKTFYEIGDSSSPIVERSRRIHETYLAEVDPKLASHLQTIEILPQIFLIRWMRLLFLREFGLGDTLLMWDVLFSDNLDLSLVDMTCLAMLLRVRWKLLKADSAEALHLLLHFEAPRPPHGPATLVRDAALLHQNMTREIGSSLIAQYSGRHPSLSSKEAPESTRRPPSLHFKQTKGNDERLATGSTGSPTRSPTYLLSPPKGLESLFSEMSGNLHKKAEHWKVPKAMRKAVGEIRRNVDYLQSGRESPRHGSEIAAAPDSPSIEGHANMGFPSRRLAILEKRNQNLANMLANALDELRAQNRSPNLEPIDKTEDSFDSALAKVQAVQKCLADPEIPISEHCVLLAAQQNISGLEKAIESESEQPNVAVQPEGSSTVIGTLQDGRAIRDVSQNSHDSSNKIEQKSTSQTGLIDSQDILAEQDPEIGRAKPKSSCSPPSGRVALAHSPLSWMLGEGQRHSDFVSFSTPPPEQRRDSVPKPRPKQLFPDGRNGEVRHDFESVDDGFVMSPLIGGDTVQR